jgi:acyl-lipid omega-6 desaturase (Delta-12 desaturase)
MSSLTHADRELLDASRPFAQEDPARSWLHVVTTFVVLGLAIAVAAFAPWRALRWAGTLVEALTLLRAFILFHDHMHGALLRGSPAAVALFRVLGVLLLTPARMWTDTHNFHHAHTARLGSAPTGTYVFWSTEEWRAASPWRRFLYRLERHPITMILGHPVVFFLGMCVLPFVSQPRRHAECGLAVALHVGLAIALWRVAGAELCVATLLAPFAIACAVGSYLFYAQHNAPGIVMRAEGAWSHSTGALDGSSYLETGPIFRWFTGNIGYHHVHHLNVRIPFYRLPEAMKALPALQSPVVTTLRPRDVVACLRLALWDSARGRLVPITRGPM